MLPVILTDIWPSFYIRSNAPYCATSRRCGISILLMRSSITTFIGIWCGHIKILASYTILPIRMYVCINEFSRIRITHIFVAAYKKKYRFNVSCANKMKQKKNTMNVANMQKKNLYSILNVLLAYFQIGKNDPVSFFSLNTTASECIIFFRVYRGCRPKILFKHLFIL